MAVFNLVHLTDLHFGHLPNQTNIAQSNLFRRKLGRATRRLLAPATHDLVISERVAAWVFDTSARLEHEDDTLDALVLSGDLATTGQQDDLDAALQYIDAPPAKDFYRAPAPGEEDDSAHLATVAELANLCFLIPGNHDRYKNNSGNAGGTRFDAVFNKYWSNNTHGVIASIIEKPATASSFDQLERLALVGADGCLRRRADAPMLGAFERSQGFVYPNTLTALKEKTIEARRQFPGITVIWVIHFPPHGNVSWYERMFEYENVEAASKVLNVSVILSGHTHENLVYPVGLGSTIWNGGSATQYAESRGNWIQYLEIEIVKSRLIRAERVNYQYNDNTGNFDQVSSDILP